MTIMSKAGPCAALAGVLVVAVSAYAVTPEQKCQEKKLKAQGKLELCLKKNSAKVIAGKPDAAAACKTMFSDALTKAGTACHYLDNGDGTVSDLNTGLMWEQKDASSGGAILSDPHDVDNTYTWAAAMSGWLSLVNGYSADGTAQTGLAGHSDWRLPTSAELQTILLAPFPCGTSPCIDSIFGPTAQSAYWSSTTFSSVPTSAWFVYFNIDGLVGLGNKTSPNAFGPSATACDLIL
jgi:hypothetical protein